MNTRIRVPETAAPGEVVEIRAMAMHPMDNGFMVTTQGATIPMHILTDFVCRYAGAEVFRVALGPGISANPIFAFRLRATETGPVEFEWTDQDGTVTTASSILTVA